MVYVVYLRTGREANRLFNSNVPLLMLVAQRGGKEMSGGEGRWTSFFLEPGKAGHLTGSCIIITWKWYGYDFILKWPLLKDKDTQLENTQKVCNKNPKRQILGFTSCSHIHRFYQISLSWEVLPTGVSQLKNNNNKTYKIFLNLFL